MQQKSWPEQTVRCDTIRRMSNQPGQAMNTPAAASAAGASACDVLVIGGGPAGATAAALLAERGYRVTLLEKAHHPRFHIGESLLPANLPLLEKLGVADAVKAIGMEKWGAEFVSPWHEHKQSFEFADAMDKSMPMAYQVRRAEFDEILIRNASRKNARVVEGCQVQDVDFLPDNAGALVQARHDDGSIETVHARFVLDASGRDTFLGNRFKAKRRNRKHNSSRHLRPLFGGRAQPGQGRRQYHHFLVRAWLVLVYPAGRRHDQRRRGDLAVLPEDAQQEIARAVPAGNHRTVRALERAAATRAAELAG